MKRKLTPVALVSSLVLAGCAADTSENDWSEALAQRAFPTGLSVAFEPETITATLPSTTYVGDVGADEFNYSELVATGDFTSFERGDAIDWSSDEGEAVDWSSDRADTREIQLTFEVDNIIDELESSDVEPGEELPVWITVDGLDDAEMVASGLLDIEKSLVFLTRHPANVYDGGWTVSLDGALVGSVNPETGEFTLPVFEAATRVRSAEEPSISQDASNLDELILSAKEDKEVVIQDAE